jgi:WD40 repeat protein
MDQKWVRDWQPYGVWNDLLSFSPEGKELLVGSGMYTALNNFWNTETGASINKDDIDPEVDWFNPNGLIIHRDSNWSVDVRSLGSEDPYLAVTDSEMGGLEFELTELASERNMWMIETETRLSPSGEWLAGFGVREEEVFTLLWHVPTRRLVRETQIDRTVFPAWWSDSIHNAVLSNNGVLYLSDVETNKLVRLNAKTGATKSVLLPEAGIAAVALNHNERELVVVGLEGNLQRLDAQSLEEIADPLDSHVHQLNGNQYAPFYLASPIAHSSNGLIWASLNQEREVVIRSSCSDVALATIPSPQLPEAESSEWMRNYLTAYGLAFDAKTQQLAVVRQGELSVWRIEVLTE